MKYFMTTLFLYLFASFAFADQSRSLEKNFPVPPGQAVSIQGFIGSEMKLQSWDSSRIRITITVEISMAEAKEEQQYLGAIDISQRTGNDGITITFEQPENFHSDGISGFFHALFHGTHYSKKISGTIMVPRNNPLTADMRYGSVSLEGMTGPVNMLGTSNFLELKHCTDLRKVENNYGTSTTILNCGGTLALHSQSSTVTIEDFKGSAVINADYSTVKVKNIDSDLSISDVSGKVSVAQAGGRVSVNANYSSISLSSVKGFADIRSRSSSLIEVLDAGGAAVDGDYSTIKLYNITGTSGREIVIKDQSGKIDIDHVIGNTSIKADYTDVSLNDVKGNVSVETTSGSIKATSVNGSWKSVSKYTGVDLTDISAKDIDISTTSQPVTVVCRTVPASVTIDNSYGSADVNVPSTYAGDISLEVQYGEIESEFPLRTKSNGSGAVGTGHVGNGSGNIRIKVMSGNITLKSRQ